MGFLLNIKISEEELEMRLICLCRTAWPFYPFLVAATGQLMWQILTVDLSNRMDCNRKYVCFHIFLLKPTIVTSLVYILFSYVFY